jgi:hypothetical protein
MMLLFGSFLGVATRVEALREYLGHGTVLPSIPLTFGGYVEALVKEWRRECAENKDSGVAVIPTYPTVCLFRQEVKWETCTGNTRYGIIRLHGGEWEVFYESSQEEGVHEQIKKHILRIEKAPPTSEAAWIAWIATPRHGRAFLSAPKVDQSRIIQLTDVQLEAIEEALQNPKATRLAGLGAYAYAGNEALPCGKDIAVAYYEDAWVLVNREWAERVWAAAEATA